MTAAPAHESLGKHQPKRVAVGGRIGSVLEYYNFLIYAAAAALIFPQIFFPKDDPEMAIIASLATYGMGYITRPVGAFVLDHLGDMHGRKNVLFWCMFLMGFPTTAVGLLPTYDQVGLLAPTLLIIMRLTQGFTMIDGISGASSMILEHTPFGRHRFYASLTLQGVQVGQILATAVFLPLAHYMSAEQSNIWGWHTPFVLSLVVTIAGYAICREIHETPAFTAEKEQQAQPRSPVIDTFRYSTPNVLRVVCMALMSVTPIVATIFGTAYTVQPAYGIGFARDIYLWIPMVGNVVAVPVIPYVGDLFDRTGHKPPIVIGSLLVGPLVFAYLYTISVKNVPSAFAMSILIWDVVYQGYNAVFPSFCPELFPTRTRVSVMAISQNIGTTITTTLPAILTAAASPGAINIWLTMGATAFGVTMVAAATAMSARETYHIHMGELGQPAAQSVDKAEYARQRAGALAT